MNNVKHISTRLPNIKRCFRSSQVDLAWQIRPMTIKDNTRRMLEVSCDFFCEHSACADDALTEQA